MKNTFLIIVGLILAATLIVLCFVFFIAWGLSAQVERSQLLLELFKGLLQLALILIIGGAIKWFYDEATQERRKDEIEKDKNVQRAAEVKASQREILHRFHEGRVSFLDRLESHSRNRVNFTDRGEGDSVEYNLNSTTLEELRRNLIATAFELDTTPTLFKEHKNIQQQLQELVSILEAVGEEYKSQEELPDSIQQEVLFEQRPKYGYFRKHLDEFDEKLNVVEALMRKDIIGSM